MKLHRSVLAMGLLLLTACPTSQGPPQTPPPPSESAHAPPTETPAQKPPEVTTIVVSGDYVHAKSGFVFPEKFGKLDRSGVAQFDSAGNDVGIGYDLVEGDLQLAATIYVAPPARTSDGERLTLEQVFQLEAASIAKFHSDVTATAPWTPKQTKNLEPAPGYAIGFRYVESFHGQKQPVESLLEVFEYEGWVVKYRITYLESQRDRANVLAQVLPQIFLLKGKGGD